MADTPPHATPGVPPGPIPTMVVTGQADDGHGGMIPVVQFQTPQGNSIFFLSIELAEHLGNELLAMASAGRSNLVVPTNGHLKPVADPPLS